MTQESVQNIWRNRIVRYGEEDPRQLLANEQNWRIHPREQQEAVEGSLSEIGWIQDVVINLRSSEEWGVDRNVETMVDGHLRVILAVRHDQPTIPVKYVDLNPNEERLALIMLDPTSAMAGTDKEKLLLLMNTAETKDDRIKSTLALMARDKRIPYGEPENPPDDPGADFDRAAELQEKWGVKTGDLFGMKPFAKCPDCGKVHYL